MLQRNTSLAELASREISPLTVRTKTEMASKLQSPAEPVVPQFGARLCKVESTLEEMEEGAIAELQASVTGLHHQVTGVETQVGDLASRVAGLESRMAGVEREISIMREEVSAMRREVQAITAAVTAAVSGNVPLLRYCLERESISRNPTTCATAYRGSFVCG